MHIVADVHLPSHWPLSLWWKLIRYVEIQGHCNIRLSIVYLLRLGGWTVGWGELCANSSQRIRSQTRQLLRRISDRGIFNCKMYTSDVDYLRKWRLLDQGRQVALWYNDISTHRGWVVLWYSARLSQLVSLIGPRQLLGERGSAPSVILAKLFGILLPSSGGLYFIFSTKASWSRGFEVYNNMIPVCTSNIFCCLTAF